MYPDSFNTTRSHTESYSDELTNSKDISNEDNWIPHISSLFERPILKLICGEDDRTQFNGREYPYKMISRLIITARNGAEYSGTGFFISPRCIVTSGHCVFLGSNWARSVTVIPGANGIKDERPFGSSTSQDFRSVEGWTKNRNRDFDYGAVILPDRSLFDRVQDHFDIDIVSQELNLTGAGYSSEIEKEKQLWGSSGSIRKLTSHRIFYDIDTENGNSGSPLFFMAEGRAKVVGIHSFGECPNFCVRINEDALKSLNKWSNV
jgi:glutamyl endopeptidase